MCFMVVRRVTGELQCLYLRQPELFNPRLQHVFQSAVHLFGILHLKNQTETLRFNKSHRKLRHVAAGVTSRGQYSNIPVIWTGIRQDGSGEHLGSFTCAQTHLESTAQQSSFSWVVEFNSHNVLWLVSLCFSRTNTNKTVYTLMLIC